MLINLTNHPSSKWNEKQLQIAQEEFGDILDIPFPHISPEITMEKIRELVNQYEREIRCINDLKAIHIQGELTFTFMMVDRCRSLEIPCVASTTERNVIEKKDGTRIFKFNFVAFRPYF